MQNSKKSPVSKSNKPNSLPYGFKAKAERISSQYRGYFNLKPFDPLPSDLLTNYLDICIKEVHTIDDISKATVSDLLDDFSSAFSAVTLYCNENDRYMIVHNHTHADSRKESNLMHECAHIILGHKMEEFDSSIGYLRNYNNVQEEEAKYLGHCLQLPKAALIKYYVYENKTKEELISQFNASMKVINYRIRICNMDGFKANVANKFK